MMEHSEYRETALPIDEALAAWKGTLERVFKTESGLPTIGGGLDLDGDPTDGPTAVLLAGKDDPNRIPTTDGTYCIDKIYVCRHKVAQSAGIYSGIPGHQL